MWVIGDDFVHGTFAHHVTTNTEIEFFMKEHFNIKELSSNALHGGNVMNRLYNCVVRGINEQILLPKLIVIIPDSDMIKNITYDAYGLSGIYGICVDYIIKCIHHLITDHKSSLPVKCSRFKYPTILWILPPDIKVFDDNNKRAKCAKALEMSVMQFNEMRFARLKSWNYTEQGLAVSTPTGYRFAKKGLLHYWMAVDAALKFWVTTSNQIPNRIQKKKHAWTRTFKDSH